MIIVNKLGKTLSELDPANADVYAANAGAYAAKLADLDKEYKDLVAGAVRKTIIVGDRFPLRYFADAYGLNYFAAFTGCSTDTEASARTIAFLIDEVDRKSTRLNSSHARISYAVFCLKKKKSA